MNPRRLSLILALLSCASGIAAAAAPDVSGSWKWIFERDGESRVITMELQQEDAKVTGTIIGPDDNELEIREGKITADGKLTFLLPIERDGNNLRVNFNGQSSGDTITGNTKYINQQGEEREREWVAKREKKSAAHDVSGEWKSAFKRQDGTSMETTLHLKQTGDKLAGKSSWGNGNETELQEGKVQGDEVSFRIIRERDGRTITTKYRGKIQENQSIKGQMESDWTGEIRRMDWEAKKNAVIRGSYGKRRPPPRAAFFSSPLIAGVIPKLPHIPRRGNRTVKFYNTRGKKSESGSALKLTLGEALKVWPRSAFRGWREPLRMKSRGENSGNRPGPRTPGAAASVVS
jgi:hypothetical protein